jgi:hypothetical protein
MVECLAVLVGRIQTSDYPLSLGGVGVQCRRSSKGEKGVCKSFALIASERNICADFGSLFENLFDYS